MMDYFSSQVYSTASSSIFMALASHVFETPENANNARSYQLKAEKFLHSPLFRVMRVACHCSMTGQSWKSFSPFRCLEKQQIRRRRDKIFHSGHFHSIALPGGDSVEMASKNGDHLMANESPDRLQVYYFYDHVVNRYKVSLDDAYSDIMVGKDFIQISSKTATFCDHLPINRGINEL